MRMQAGAAQSKSSAMRNHAKAGEQAHGTSGTFGLNLEGGAPTSNSGQQAPFNPRASSERQQLLDGKRSNAVNIVVASPTLKAGASKQAAAGQSRQEDNINDQKERSPIIEANTHEHTDTARDVNSPPPDSEAPRAGK